MIKLFNKMKFKNKEFTKIVKIVKYMVKIKILITIKIKNLIYKYNKNMIFNIQVIMMVIKKCIILVNPRQFNKNILIMKTYKYLINNFSSNIRMINKKKIDNFIIYY